MTEHTDCDRHQSAFEDLLAGGSDDERTRALLAHADECDECRRLWDLHDDLRDLAPRAPRPSEHELRRMRASVIEAIRAEGAGAGPARARSYFGWVALAASLAALVGFATGRVTLPEVDQTAQPAVLAEDASLSSAIRQAATGHRELADIEESPFVYSDVRVRETGPGQLALSFTVSSHLEMEAPVDDPVVTEVLVQSLLDSGSVGQQLDAISVAPALDPRVRDALVKTMLEDRDVAVRLEAQARLSAHRPDAAVEAAFLRVLSEEESVQMRLAAIDYLAEHGVKAQMIDDAATENPSESRAAVLARIEERLSI